VSKPKAVNPQFVTLVEAVRAERERLLKELELARGTVLDTLRALTEIEAILQRYDPGFEQPLRRLAFTRPLDAATLLLMEMDNRPIREADLIKMMLDHGVCMANAEPKADIKRAFSRASVRKKLHFDEATGCVTIAAEYCKCVMPSISPRVRSSRSKSAVMR